MLPDSVPVSVSVALVEDDEVMRARLVRALGRAPGIEVVHAAATAGAMIDWLERHSAAVLLVDLGLPDRSGLDVIRYCRQHAPGSEVMVVTLFGDENHMIRAFEAGARGYILKDGTEEELARHVLSLHAGGSPMTPVIARQLLDRMAIATQGAAAEVPEADGRAIRGPGDGSMLSVREHEILRILSRGYTYAETAQLLDIAFSTVQSHVKNIYSKLAVRSRTEAVFEARQMGLL